MEAANFPGKQLLILPPKNQPEGISFSVSVSLRETLDWMKTAPFTQSKWSKTEKHKPSQINVFPLDVSHSLNASQIGDISTRTISQREWFIARVSGKFLRGKVRKQFDIRALEVFFHSTRIKALCFLFFSKSVPPHQSYHNVSHALQLYEEIFNGMLSREYSA